MKITNMNRNQLASYAAQMRDRSRGLDRIMGELKGERKENRRLVVWAEQRDVEWDILVDSDAAKTEHIDELRTQIADLEAEIKKRADEYTDYHDAVNAEITELKKPLAAKPGAAEKVDGVFEVGDEVRVVSRMTPKCSMWHDGMDKLIGRIGSVLEVRSSGDIVTDLSEGCGWQYIFHAGSLRHASPATSPCQSCAAKDAEIAALNESRTCVANECSALNDVIETLKKAAHRDWVKSDRTDVELYNAQLDLEKLQSQIETQRKNSSDTQRNLERAREIIGHHEASILRVTAELTAALGGG